MKRVLENVRVYFASAGIELGGGGGGFPG